MGGDRGTGEEKTGEMRWSKDGGGTGEQAYDRKLGKSIGGLTTGRVDGWGEQLNVGSKQFLF